MSPSLLSAIVTCLLGAQIYVHVDVDQLTHPAEPLDKHIDSEPVALPYYGRRGEIDSGQLHSPFMRRV